MSRLDRHPSWRELNRLADDELENGPRRMALEHVAGCPRCARRMSFLASLREAGREMRHPSPPKDLLDDILRSRKEGGRI
ncbi:MAG: zf-HC2 domain-containing protein, partial [Gemmatimonadota bacterium]